MQENQKLSFIHLLPSFAAIIVDSFGFGLAYPVLTALLSTPSDHFLGHISPALRDFYLGLGFMLYPLFMFFGASFLGDLSDKWGRKKVLLICMAGLTISSVIMGFGILAGSVTMLMVGRAASGLAAGSQPLAQAAIADSSPKELKARNMAFVTLTVCIGIVLGPLLGGVLSDHTITPLFTYETPFFFTAGLAFLIGLWIYFEFNETFDPPPKTKLSWWGPFLVLFRAAKHPAMRWLTPTFFLMQFGFAIYYTIILVFLKVEYGYRSSYLGYFTGYLGICFVVSMLIVIPYVMKHIRVEKIAIVTLLLTGFFELFMTFVDNELLTWILAFPIGGFDVIAYSAMLTCFSNASDSANQGWAMGISGAVVALSFAAGGLTTNLIPLVGLHWIFFIGGVVMLFAGLILLLGYNIATLRDAEHAID
ncbi:MAG: Tetracycline resistance protein, class C [Chlamydiia bacterium]|nr:Tetracycline resistance protein, class C [Chlamydiia bacterium]